MARPRREHGPADRPKKLPAPSHPAQVHPLHQAGCTPCTKPGADPAPQTHRCDAPHRAHTRLRCRRPGARRQHSAAQRTTWWQRTTPLRIAQRAGRAHCGTHRALRGLTRHRGVASGVALACVGVALVPAGRTAARTAVQHCCTAGGQHATVAWRGAWCCAWRALEWQRRRLCVRWCTCVQFEM